MRWQDLDDPGTDHGLAVDDFSVVASGSGTGESAPSVISTSPADQAINIAVDSNIVINFSESVSATASAFLLECPAGAAQSFSQTASPASSVTLTPAVDLPYSTTCTVTVTRRPDLGCRHERSARRAGSGRHVLVHDREFAAARGDQRHHQRDGLRHSGRRRCRVRRALRRRRRQHAARWSGRRLLQRNQRPVLCGVRSRRVPDRREWLLYAWEPWRSRSRSRLQSRCRRSAAERRRCGRALRRQRGGLSERLGPSPRRISWTPSSTTPTMRTMPDCSHCSMRDSRRSMKTAAAAAPRTRASAAPTVSAALATRRHTCRSRPLLAP